MQLYVKIHGKKHYAYKNIPRVKHFRVNFESRKIFWGLSALCTNKLPKHKVLLGTINPDMQLQLILQHRKSCN